MSSDVSSTCDTGLSTDEVLSPSKLDDAGGKPGKNLALKECLEDIHMYENASSRSAVTCSEGLFYDLDRPAKAPAYTGCQDRTFSRSSRLFTFQ